MNRMLAVTTLRAVSGRINSLFILIILFIGIFPQCSNVEEPKEVLGKYKIGSSLHSLSIDEKSIFFQLKLEKKVGFINIMVGNRSKPRRVLDYNERLIILREGEFLIYLYFDKSDILYKTEIVGP